MNAKAKAKKFIEDCEIPFCLERLFQRGRSNFCGISLKDGRRLEYVPMPVRYGVAPFNRYLSSEAGQKAIKEMLDRQAG